jgi:hypothetical protein
MAEVGAEMMKSAPKNSWWHRFSTGAHRLKTCATIILSCLTGKPQVPKQLFSMIFAEAL